MNMQFALLLIAGTAGGLLFAVLHIPGGMMFGAVLAVLALEAAPAPEAPEVVPVYPLAGNVDIHIPPLFHACSQIAIGIVVGNMLTSQMLVEIRNMAGLMILSTAILVVAGFISAFFISRQTGMDPGSAILATSPGGLQAVVGLASDLGSRAPMVMAFQMVRLYAVVFLAPLISWLLGHFLK